MNKKYFPELLNKYLKHEASEAECELLIKHYNLFDSEPDIFDSLSQNQKANIRNEIENKIWDEILDDEIHPKEVSHSNNRMWINFSSVAAVLLIIFSAGFYFLKKEPIKEE